MQEFIITGIFGAALIAISSFIIYEILRFTWRILPKINWQPHLRIFALVAGIFAGHILNIWLFGIVYFIFTIFGWGSFTSPTINLPHELDIFSCIYISSTLYTTVGAGDVTPNGGLRMIVGVEALTGFMLIGWTISFAYLAMEKFWQLPHRKNSKN